MEFNVHTHCNYCHHLQSPALKKKEKNPSIFNTSLHKDLGVRLYHSHECYNTALTRTWIGERISCGLPSCSPQPAAHSHWRGRDAPPFDGQGRGQRNKIRPQPEGNREKKTIDNNNEKIIQSFYDYKIKV